MSTSARPELLILGGLPASGKSTAAKAWLAEDPDGRVRVNWDDLRAGMFGPNWIFNRREEEQMKAQSISIVEKALMAGLSVVVDNTNLAQSARNIWKALGQKYYATLIEQEIDTDPDECVRRDRLRPTGSRVGQAVIDNMAIRYGLLDWNNCNCDGDACTLRQSLVNGHAPGCRAIRPIAIVDLDGTVADCTARMHYITRKCLKCQRVKAQDTQICQRPVRDGEPVMCGGEFSKKDWSAFFREVANDTPLEGVRRLVNHLATDHTIVILSGRPINDRDIKVGILTEDWLLKHDIHFDRMLLKPLGSHTHGEIWKQEAIDYLPRERAKFVFDDHGTCCDMYRRELPHATVLQVGSSNFS